MDRTSTPGTAGSKSLTKYHSVVLSRTYLETPPCETYRRAAISVDKADKRLLFLSHVKRMAADRIALNTSI